MELDANSELLIRRFLLSSLSEEEREQIETRLMTDDQFFQQINLVEDELIEEYLDGELPDADRSRFENTFLCAPERQHKLRFTKALRAHAANALKEKTPRIDPSRRHWYEGFLDLFDISRPVLAYSLAAALLMLVGGGALMIVQTGGLKGQISGLQARYEKEHERADQIASLLRDQEQRAAAQSGMMSEFTLSPGAQRSAEPTKSLEMPKGALLVPVKLDLAENWKETYKAVLLSSGDREILTRSNLKAAVSDREITISFVVPATDLPSGNYLIRLYGSGENEVRETYSFRVVKN
jgi:hypothetical protein